MQSGRDPVERAAEDDRDLYGVSTWEPRSALDRVATRVHGAIRPLARGMLVALATLLLVGALASGLISVVTDPSVRFFVALSVVPALLLAVYVRYADVTSREPPGLLVVTFVLGVLFASFAGMINGLASSGLAGADLPLDGDGAVLTGVSGAVFFFLVVGPAEETVKLLAVRLYAFRDGRFDSVVDGAVYGAVAGLGFATIENALYITGEAGAGTGVPELAGLAAVRALAGPGHVIYSGIAGYYLGLAKFNRDHAGPLVVKGLLIAAVLHGTYNTLVGFVPGAVAESVAGLSVAGAFVGFVVVFDGLAGLYLFRKVHRYGRFYRAVGAGRTRTADPAPELAEFEADPGWGRPHSRESGRDPAADGSGPGESGTDPGDERSDPREKNADASRTDPGRSEPRPGESGSDPGAGDPPTGPSTADPGRDDP